METVKKYGWLFALVVALIALFVSSSAMSQPASFGGGGTSDFTNVNVKSGGSYSVADTAVIDSSRNGSFAAITATGDATFGSGFIKTTGALVEQSVSSTFKIGNDASGLGTGCLVLGDSGGATSTPVYITATGDTVTATTTAPAICR